MQTFLLSNNQLCFVRRLPKYYYRKNDGSIRIVNEPHSYIFYEGKMLNVNYMAGNWKTYSNYRKIDESIHTIILSSGHWW